MDNSCFVDVFKYIRERLFLGVWVTGYGNGCFGMGDVVNMSIIN